MKEQQLLHKISSFFEANNIELFGINSSSLLDEAPAGFQPKDYLPDARSFICFATPVPKGVYSPGTYKKEFVWRTQNLLYRQLDTLSIQTANILEKDGFTSIPFFGCMPQRYNSRKELAGFMNQIMMGSIAGIGFIGKNGLLINYRFGSRIMLGAVLTNADLPVYAKSPCGMLSCAPDCRICADVCPVKAIIPEDKKVKIMKCLYYTAKVHSLPKIRFFIQRFLAPEKSLQLMNYTAFDENTRHVCSLCVSECPFNK